MNIYSIARQTKDKNFDGKFYFAVKTTGIFCRPSCPSTIAKEKNVLYFDTVQEAKKEGFRPCKRCQPEVFMEHYQHNMDGIRLMIASLKDVKDAYLLEHSLEDLASKHHVSLRQLRHLYSEHMGTSPIKISLFQKVLFAQALLKETKKAITDIAFEAGFGSTRQFNDVFKKLVSVSPSAYRKKPNYLPKLTLELPYDDHFCYEHVLDFLPHRITRGVESIEEGVYSRSFRLNESYGYINVSDQVGHLAIDLFTNDVTVCYEIYQKIIGLFDLDTDFGPILKRFSNDDMLSSGFIDGQIPRLPKAFDTFELTIRAIINQQISIKATSTYMKRIVEKAGLKTSKEFPEHISHYFPSVDEMRLMSFEDIGLTKTRQQTLINVIEALFNEEVSLSINQSFEHFRESFIKVKGIGDWTINYVALRALGMVDSFPAKDLGVIKALGTKKEKELIAIAEKWQPYRGYATLCLWHRE